MALDVRGASDYSGANVLQYTPNGTDAQIWSVVNTSSGRYQIINSLSGNSLDVAGGTMADGTNVQAYCDNDSQAQRWNPVADGSTYTYNDVDYYTYVVYCTKDSTYVLDVSAGGTTAGSNVQIYTANSTDAQRWIFVPVSCMTTGGTYRLRSALADDLAVDVSGGSNADGANAQIWSVNDTNAQIFQAKVDSDSLTSVFIRPDCGKALDVTSGSSTDGTNVQQWAVNSSRAQQWLPVMVGTTTVNGTTVPVYALHVQTGSGKVMDVAGGGTKLATNVQIYPYNASLAQKFWLEKTSYLDSGIASPIIDGISVSSSYNPTKSHGVDSGTVTARICIRSFSDYVQVRYRVKKYAYNSRTAEISEWRDAVNDSTANNGWGDPWTGYAASGETVMPVEIACAVSNSGYDRFDVEIQARGFDPSRNYGAAARSATTTATSIVYRVPTVTVESAAIVESGLKVVLTSDYHHYVNAVKVTANGGSGRVTGVYGTSDIGVIIPWSSIREPIQSGSTMQASVAVSYSFTTSETTVTGTSTVALDTSSVAVSVVSSTIENLVQTITLSVEPRVAKVMWNGIDGERIEDCIINGNKVIVPYPFGIDYVVHVQVYDETESVGVSNLIYSSVNEKAFSWLYDETSTGWTECHLIVNQDKAPSLSRSVGYSTSSANTNGRDHPFVTAWGVRSLDLGVSGVVPAETIDDLDSSDMRDFYALSETLGRGEYPLYRSPQGDYERVAISSIDMDAINPDWVQCSIDQQAVSL